MKVKPKMATKVLHSRTGANVVVNRAGGATATRPAQTMGIWSDEEEEEEESDEDDMMGVKDLEADDLGLPKPTSLGFSDVAGTPSTARGSPKAFTSRKSSEVDTSGSSEEEEEDEHDAGEGKGCTGTTGTVEQSSEDVNMEDAEPKDDAGTDGAASNGDARRSQGQAAIADVAGPSGASSANLAADDDPIVARVPVKISHFADAQGFYADFYCVKYPTRPLYRPYGEREQLVSVDMQKHKKCARFSYSLGNSTGAEGGNQLDHFGRGASSSSASEHRNSDSKYSKLQSLKLLGNRVEPHSGSTLFAGAIRNGVFHLTPCTGGVLQMRPDLSHVNTGVISLEEKLGAMELSMEDKSLLGAPSGKKGAGVSSGTSCSASSSMMNSSSGAKSSAAAAGSSLPGSSSGGSRAVGSGGGTSGDAKTDPWVAQSLFVHGSEEACEVNEQYLLSDESAACSMDSGSWLVYEQPQNLSHALGGGTGRLSVDGRLPRPSEQKRQKMMNGTGGEGDSVRSVADKRKQEQDALRRDYFNTLVKNSLQQQTGAAQQASSGTSSLTAASSSSSTTAGNYKPPTGPLAISDYGLSRLSVKEQFEALLRSYGDAALPANFHHIFWHRLPPATRRYLSNVDTIFGSLIQKNPSSPRKLPGASGFAAAEGTSDIVLVDAQSTSPTGQNGEPEVLNDEKLALEYCISRYCFLAGVQIPRNSSEHYANWVVKSEFLGLVGPERLARDSLILMFMINKTKRYAPLHSWKNTLLDMCDPEMVARVERETLGAYDQDAQSGRLGRLRFYDHADEHMDPFVVERYLNSGTFERAKDEVVRNVKALKAMKSNQLELQRLEVQLLSAREGATEQQKEHLQTVREQCVQKAAASGVPEMQARNLLSSSTTEQRVLRKLLFYLRVILAERAHAEDELLRKLQTGFPTTQITAQMLEKALMEPIDCTTNCMLLATATAHQAQIKPGSGGGATTSNGKSTSARTRDLQIDDDEDEDEFEASPRNVNRRYYWKNVIGYAQCLTISDHQMAELQRIQTHCASVYDNTFRLHRQCKKVYYWKKFGTSLGLALAGSTSTSNSFNSTSTSSTSQANNYLCLLGNEHSDIRRVILDFFAQRGAGTRDEILAEVQHRVPDVERRQLTFYALRKIISEFAVYRHDRYIFLGFVGSQLHAAGAGGGR